MVIVNLSSLIIYYQQRRLIIKQGGYIMIKNQQTYQFEKPLVLIPYLIASDEVFKPVTEQAIPGVYDYYLISNYGRVYLKYQGKFMSYHLDSKGYWVGTFATTTGSITCRLHRVEKLVFDYIDNPDKYVIDHIDGNRQNMYLFNLEWVTQSENIRRSIELAKKYPNGIPQFAPQYILEDIQLREVYFGNPSQKLIKPFTITSYTQKNFNDMKSEYNCQSYSTKNTTNRTIHSDEEVIQICELLQQGYTMAYIANKLRIPKSYVSNVYHKQTRVDISCRYDFSNYGSIPYHDKWLFTTEQVMAICKYLEDNDLSVATSKKGFIRVMFSKLGIEYNDARYRTVLDIYKGRGYKNVAANYNIHHNNNQ